MGVGEQPIHSKFYKKYSWAEECQEIASEKKMSTYLFSDPYSTVE